MDDLGFALGGGTLPRTHRSELADAIGQALPWFATSAGVGMHRLNVSSEGDQVLLARRTPLRLRVPRELAGAAAALQGRDLAVGADRLRLGAVQVRELLPHGTLYAHLVATDDADEAAFLRSMQAELAAQGVVCRPICGRRQVVEGGALQGFSLMLDGLSHEGALRILERGLGPHRRLGCGLFVAHRSAAAVGELH
jgi:CRISPR-associated protein Cas6